MIFKQINLGGINFGPGENGHKLFLDELKKDLDQELDTIWFIQEPWYRSNSIKQITEVHPDFVVIMEKAGRTAIIHQQHQPLVKINHLCNKDMIVATITEKGKAPIYLISLYIDRAKRLWPPPFFRQACRQFKRKNHTAIIFMDSNSEHISWSGRERSNPEGIAMEAFFSEMQIKVHNKPERGKHTYERVRYYEETNRSRLEQTYIDLTCTMGQHQILQEWQRTDLKIADHYMLESKATLGGYKKPKKYSVKLNTYFAELAHNTQIRPERIPEKISKNTIDQMAQILEAEMRSCVDRSKKEIKSTRDHYLYNIWDQNMSEMQNQLIALNADRRKTIAKGDHPRARKLKELINCVQAKLRKAIKRGTKMKNKINLEGISGPKGMAQLFKRAKLKNYDKINQIQDENGDLTETPIQALTALALAHNIDSTMILDIENHPYAKQDYLANVEYNFRKVDEHRDIFIEKKTLTDDLLDSLQVRQILQTFGPDKKGGIDEFTPKFFQGLPQNVINYITILFQAMHLLDYTPGRWLVATNIFLPKPNKPDMTETKAWRPIGLLCLLYKAFEKAKKMHMEQNDLIEDNDFHTNQHGFRKRRSCDTALTQLVSNLEEESTNSTNKPSLVCALDYAGAFDSIHKDKLLEALEARGIDDHTRKWIKDVFERKLTRVQVGEEISLIKCPRGSFQGGVLSPLLWNIIMDTIFDRLPENVRSVAYADDLTLVVNHQGDQMATRNLMQKALKEVEKWADEYHVKIAPQKTQAMWVYSPRDQIEQEVLNQPLIVGNTEIKYANQIKILGVTLDNLLTFDAHIHNKLNHVKDLINKLEWWISPFKGPKLTHLKWAFQGIIVPTIAYACHLWYGKLTDKHLTKIRQINRSFLKRMAPLRHSSPLYGLSVIFNIMPLQFELEKRALSIALRVRKTVPVDNTNSMYRKGHLAQLEKSLKEDVGITSFDTDELDTIDTTRNSFTIDTKAMQEGKGLINRIDDIIQIFTDGSKKNGKVGYGYIITKNEEVIHTGAGKLPHTCTVFQAELMAIKEAAMFTAERLRRTATTCDIMIDSQAAIKALHTTAKVKIVKKCKEELNNLAKTMTVTLRWVKAHNEKYIKTLPKQIQDQLHTGNEIADELAKEGGGRESIFIINDPDVGTQTMNDLKNKIRDYSNGVWDKHWQELARQQTEGRQNTCRQTRIWLPERNPKKSKQILKMNKSTAGLTTSYISGHLHHGYHDYLVSKGETNPKCRYCNKDISNDLDDIRENGESASHIIRKCDKFSQQRLKAFGQAHPLADDFEWSVYQLITFIKIAKVHIDNWAFYGYLKIPETTQCQHHEGETDSEAEDVDDPMEIDDPEQIP